MPERRWTPPPDDDRRTAIVTLLDRAHAALPARDLAAMLLAVRRLVAPVATGRPFRASAGTPAVTRTATEHLRPVEWELGFARLEDEGDLRDLCGEVDRYLDEIAARPSGSAVA